MFLFPVAIVLQKDPPLIQPLRTALWALIPAHNEAPRVGRVVAAALEHVDGVLVVDDGSTDGTAAVARERGAEVMQNARRGGKGAALAAGIRRLAALGVDTAVALDADGQHRPSEIPRLVRALDAADLVIGSRMHDASPMPVRRALANHGSALLASMLSGVRLSDSQSGFRAFRVEAMERLLPALRWGGYQFETEWILRAVRAGWRIRQVPISTVYPKGGLSGFRTLRDSALFVACAIEAGLTGGGRLPAVPRLAPRPLRTEPAPGLPPAAVPAVSLHPATTARVFRPLAPQAAGSGAAR